MAADRSPPQGSASRGASLALALLGALPAACGDEPGPAAPPPGPAAADDDDDDDDDEEYAAGAIPPVEDLSALETLAHLGYAEHAEPGEEAASGVVLHEAGRAWPGYTLVTSLPDGLASLIDMAGRELRVYEDRELPHFSWARAELLRNGDVLCITTQTKQLLRLRFDGSLLWRLPLEAHHDAEELPDGRLLVLTRRFRVLPALAPERRAVDDSLTFVSSDGQVLEQHSLYDLLAAEPRLLEVRPPPDLAALPPDYDLDPIHANTVFWLADPGLARLNPLFVPGRVLVTLRYLDAVALFDLAERRCLWAWGPGEIEGPHDAKILPNGHVLLLDNGGKERGWSRVLELDPRRGEIVWQYRAPQPADFFTYGRGTVQALPNGNVLVGHSSRGEAFEVDRAGHVVWRYRNPRGSERARAVIRVERYAPEQVEPLLAADPAGG